MNIRIFPPDDFMEAVVTLPLSKSMSARALIINKIGGFQNEIEVSDADDTLALKSGLTANHGVVNVGAAGTAMRFLCAYYAATPGSDVVLDGSERMRERPIGILVDALRNLGAKIEYTLKEGYPPLHITGRKLNGGNIHLDPTVSSQYISALMMITPLMSEGLTLNFSAEPPSLPYIKMTAKMMMGAGVEPDLLYNQVVIPNHPYTRPVTEIERDWSAASYWYSITALTAGNTVFQQMQTESCQGDSVMKNFGEMLGILTQPSEDYPGSTELMAGPEQYSRLDLDMSDTPDLVQTLAVAAVTLGIPFRFTGVHTLRNKETDRLEALRTEALKLGIIMQIEGNDIISWEGQRVPIKELPSITTYKDHRMAMAFAPVSVFLPGIIIEESEVVSKSYPDFWNDMQKAGFLIEEVENHDISAQSSEI